MYQAHLLALHVEYSHDVAIAGMERCPALLAGEKGEDNRKGDKGQHPPRANHVEAILLRECR